MSAQYCESRLQAYIPTRLFRDMTRRMRCDLTIPRSLLQNIFAAKSRSFISHVLVAGSAAPQLMGRGNGQHNQQLLNLTRGYAGGSALTRPWGQKIGSNDKYNEWKLFVGQVPLEASTPRKTWLLKNISHPFKFCARILFGLSGEVPQISSRYIWVVRHLKQI